MLTTLNATELLTQSGFSFRMYTHSGLWAVNADKAGDTAYSASSFDEEIESMARLYERQELISDRGSRTSDDSFSFARGIRARTESSIGVLR